jgi:hypothetical protein
MSAPSTPVRTYKREETIALSLAIVKSEITPRRVILEGLHFSKREFNVTSLAKKLAPSMTE